MGVSFVLPSAYRHMLLCAHQHKLLCVHEHICFYGSRLCSRDPPTEPSTFGMCIVTGSETMQQPVWGQLDPKMLRNAHSACVLSSIVVLKQLHAITGNTRSRHCPQPGDAPGIHK
jgi:hypothetical protein